MRKSSSLPDMPQIAISSKYENQMWLPREHASKQDIEREQQGIIQKELLYQLALKNINESDLSSISKKHREVFKKIMESNDLEQNTYCAQQSLIQKALLYQLAVENILLSYLPNLEQTHSKIFNEIIKSVDINPKICLQIKKEGQPDPINREKFNSLINVYNIYVNNRFLVRSLATSCIKWFAPEFVNFSHSSSLPRVKEEHEILFPFLECTIFKTSPSLEKDEKYLVAIVDCEKFKSKLVEIYVKNVALTLESAVKNQDCVVGASLIIKGQIPKDLLTWLRGSSLIDLTPIPNVEVIYGLPLAPFPLTEEYFFTLKQGTKHRLKKNNSRITNDLAKNICNIWKELRPYVIIDQLIIEAKSRADNFSSFILIFWQTFNELKSPNPDLPNFINLTKNEETDKGIPEIIKTKVELYKKSLEKEIGCKAPARVNKARKLLNKIKDSPIQENVYNRIQKIAKNISEDNNLFHLDWNHLIYDTLKAKDYDLKFENITCITPGILNDKNLHREFYVNNCILKTNTSSEEDDKTIFLQLSESNSPKGGSNDYSNRLFNWTLMSIISIYMQIDLKIAKELIVQFIDNIFSHNIKRSSYSFFYEFIGHYNKATIPAQPDLKKAKKLILDLIVRSEKSATSSDEKQLKTSDKKEQSDSKFFGTDYISNISSSEIDFLHEFIMKCNNIEAQTEYKHEFVYQFSEALKFDRHPGYPFDKNILQYFVNALEDKLKNIKQEIENAMHSYPEDEAFEFDNIFDKADNLELTTNISSIDENTSSTAGTYCSEIEISKILEDINLFHNISLCDIKNLLKKYEKEFEAIGLGPSSGDIYYKLETLNTLVSFLPPNTANWKYFYFFNAYMKNYNIAKYIYVITKDEEIKVAYEPIFGNISNRPCHSQLANGLGVKAAGELIFQYDESWKLIIINNGSGHYRPPAHLSLLYAQEKILPSISKDISVDSVSLLNSLKPGMTLASGWEAITDINIPIKHETTIIGMSQNALRDVPRNRDTKRLQKILKFFIGENECSLPSVEVALRRAAAGLRPAYDCDMGEQTKVLKYLISEVTDINACSPSNGMTALHLAVTKGQVENVKILLAAKANPNLSDNIRKTAKDYALGSSVLGIKVLFYNDNINGSTQNSSGPLIQQPQNVNNEYIDSAQSKDYADKNQSCATTTTTTILAQENFSQFTPHYNSSITTNKYNLPKSELLDQEFFNSFEDDFDESDMVGDIKYSPNLR